VNPQTRESRLVKSSFQYVKRSASTIIRSYAIYRPFRFFASIAVPFAAIGSALILRWIILYFASEKYSARLPSFLFGLGFLFIAGQLLVIAFLADNTATSRRLLAESRFEARTAELDRIESERTAGA
jgi:hypothetical protein